MKTTNLGKFEGLGGFEEIILLLVGVLGKEAYAFKIAEELSFAPKDWFPSEPFIPPLSILKTKEF